MCIYTHFVLYVQPRCDLFQFNPLMALELNIIENYILMFIDKLTSSL